MINSGHYRDVRAALGDYKNKMPRRASMDG